MKKLISMLLITLMAFSLVACGGGDDVANTDPGTSSADPGQSGQTASADKDTPVSYTHLIRRLRLKRCR